MRDLWSRAGAILAKPLLLTHNMIGQPALTALYAFDVGEHDVSCFHIRADVASVLFAAPSVG